jgi:hypothetical protein
METKKFRLYDNATGTNFLGKPIPVEQRYHRPETITGVFVDKGSYIEVTDLNGVTKRSIPKGMIHSVTKGNDPWDIDRF